MLRQASRFGLLLVMLGLAMVRMMRVLYNMTVDDVSTGTVRLRACLHGLLELNLRSGGRVERRAKRRVEKWKRSALCNHTYMLDDLRS